MRNSVNFNVARGSGDAEDDEFSSVAGVLRGVLDDEGPDYTMTLIKDSDALRLDDFLDYVWEDDGATLISDTEDLGCSLTSSDIAPDVNLSLLSDPLDPPTVTWDRGNAGAHENDRFVVDVFDPGFTFPHFTSEEITGTSWTPSAREWAQMIGSRTEIELRVTAWQDDDPATGPFRGCREQRTIQAASAPLDTDGCRDITLPANDDGSTGAVDAAVHARTSSARRYTSLYVNNNGNVTFDGAAGRPTRRSASTRTTPPIIAPFFADVDTRGDGSAPGDVRLRRRRRSAAAARSASNWVNVGYFTRPHRQAEHASSCCSSTAPTSAPATSTSSSTTAASSGRPATPAAARAASAARRPAAGYSAGNGTTRTRSSRCPAPCEPGAARRRRERPRGPLQRAASRRDATSTRCATARAGNSATAWSAKVTNLGPAPAGCARSRSARRRRRACVFQTRTGSDGSFAAVGIPAGHYDVTAYPHRRQRRRPRRHRDGGPNEQLGRRHRARRRSGPPAGVTCHPDGGHRCIADGQLAHRDDAPTTGCPTATATVRGRDRDGRHARHLAEGSGRVGTRQVPATIPPLHPTSARRQVRIRLDCPSGDTRDIVFDVYIDPSGTVVDQAGSPVDGCDRDAGAQRRARGARSRWCRTAAS